jgi:predicted RNase H-like HicB family nuclease
MAQIQQFTAIIEKDEEWYVALCPELDLASQDETVEEARQNLIEALELFFETASPSEIRERLASEVFITQVRVPVA